MKTQPKTLAIAVAAALGTLGALPAQAVQFTTESANFNGSASVTDTCTVASNTSSCDNGATNKASQTLAAPNLNQFNSNQGVLVGTTIQLESERTQTISGAVTNGLKNKTSTSGTGQSDAKIIVPGASESFDTAINTGKVTATVTDKSGTAKFDTGTTLENTLTGTTLTIPDASLDDYVGGGTVTVSLTSPKLEVNSIWSNSQNNSSSKSTATYTLGWEGDLTITYEYLLHAAPSFDGSSELLTLNLDFGTVYFGGTASKDFKIYNLLPDQYNLGDQVGLDLDDFTPLTGPTPFSSGLSSFTNLASGGIKSYIASMDTSILGSYSASYVLNFSDADVGASLSRFDSTSQPNNYRMILNLTGSVIERLTPVPEPGALALLGIGLLGLRFGRRKSA